MHIFSSSIPVGNAITQVTFSIESGRFKGWSLRLLLEICADSPEHIFNSKPALERPIRAEDLICSPSLLKISDSKCFLASVISISRVFIASSTAWNLQEDRSRVSTSGADT